MKTSKEEKLIELLEYFYEFAVLNDDGEDVSFSHKVRDAAVILGKEAFKAPEDSKWLPNITGLPPADLAPETQVQVQFRNGELSDLHLEEDSSIPSWDWAIDWGTEYEIMFYRVLA